MTTARLQAGALLALGLAWVLWQALSLPPVPVMDPDSGSYLDFAAIRTAAYPLFLKLFGPQTAMALQPPLYAAAATLLALATLAVGRNGWLAAAVLLLLLVNPEVNKYHARILTESLFMAGLMLFLVAVLGFFRRPDWRGAAAAALLAGLVAAIRPTGYALLPVLPVMALMVRHRLPGSFALVLAAALLPMLAVVAGERLYTAAAHGADATSLAGRHVYAKAAMVEAPVPTAAEADPVRRRLAEAAEHDFAPVRRLLAEAPDAEVLSVLTANYETCLEYACVADLRAATGLREPALNADALAVGAARLAAAPLAYAGLAWRHYRAMWALYAQTHPALAPGFDAFVAAHRPLPFETLVPSLAAGPPPDRKAILLRPAMIAVGGLTALLALAALGAAARGRGAGGPLMETALVAALALHGTLAWTAMVGVGIPRYTIGDWPLMVAALSFAGIALWRALLFRRTQEAA